MLYQRIRHTGEQFYSICSFERSLAVLVPVIVLHNFQHEEMSCRMFDYILEKHHHIKLKLTNEEVDFIKEQISGSKSRTYCNNRKDFLYEVTDLNLFRFCAMKPNGYVPINMYLLLPFLECLFRLDHI